MKVGCREIESRVFSHRRLLPGSFRGSFPVWSQKKQAATGISGARFGDNLAPISDTTVASALTQGAPIGEVVRTRLKYALTAATATAVGLVAIVTGWGSRRG